MNPVVQPAFIRGGLGSVGTAPGLLSLMQSGIELRDITTERAFQ